MRLDFFTLSLDWQDERPPAPSYLRVLYLGRMLQDDETLLSEYSFLFISFPNPRDKLFKQPGRRYTLEKYQLHVFLPPGI